MENRKRTILIPTEFFIPGYKGGGTVRALKNLIDHLGEDFGFKIITRDRDLGDHHGYLDIVTNRWQRRGNYEVLYLSPSRLSARGIYSLLRLTKYDLLYLNSFFSIHFSIIPLLLRRFRLVTPLPVILAPKGEFSRGAMALNRFRKKTYLKIFRLLGIHKTIEWQASTGMEENDIRLFFGKEALVSIVPDLLPAVSMNMDAGRAVKNKKNGSLDLVFLSRIAPIKNLAGALNMLKGVRGKIRFNIYGPVVDHAYLKDCREITKKLPENIRVSFHGGVPHDRIPEIMRENDFLFHPTMGENFGHVIFEALANGCPVLISDRTPWRNLEKMGIGWDIPLEEPGLFQEVLQKCARMDAETYRHLSENAMSFALNYGNDGKDIMKNRRLFQLKLS